MKGGSKVKAILVMVILLLVGVLAVVGVGAVKTYMSGATEDEAPTGIATEATEDCRGVVITFKTAIPVQAMVMFGSSPSSTLLRKAEETKTTDHVLSLTPLKPDSTVYFKILINDTTYDNGGVAYSAKTCSGGESSMSDDAAVETPPVSPDVSVPTTVLIPTVPADVGATTGTTTGSGECNKTNDYDGDGTVTTFDYYFCLRGVPTPTTKVLDDCFNVDFNKDGVINAIDRIQCLQSKGN